MNPTPRILVVDDDPEGCGALVALLTAVFPETEQARDAEEALARLRTQVYDIVLANVSIKGVRGTELLQRALENKCDAGFILMADKPEPADFASGIRHKALDFLVKPFPASAVVESVHSAYREVAGKREERELRKKLEDGLARRTHELDQAFQHLQGTYRATLEALVMALDAREHDTSTHSFRVRAYTLHLARAAGVAPIHLPSIAEGALLHDIGKIGIPDAILSKPGQLTPDEWREMRNHPVYGHRILSRVPFLESACMLVLHHHERYNGSGYPFGLKGEHIPLASRLFAIVDTYDAITSDRPYRKAQGHAAALEVIRNEAGSLFDPRLSPVFYSIAEREWREIREQIDAETAAPLLGQLQ